MGVDAATVSEGDEARQDDDEEDVPEADTATTAGQVEMKAKAAGTQQLSKRAETFKFIGWY